MSEHDQKGLWTAGSFEVLNETRDGTNATLELGGHLDAEGAPVLMESLEALLEDGVRQVTLDFTNVDFLSSSGIGSLIASIGEYRDEGGDVVIAALSESLRAVLEMLDLLDYVTMRQG